MAMTKNSVFVERGDGRVDGARGSISAFWVATANLRRIPCGIRGASYRRASPGTTVAATFSIAGGSARPEEDEGV